MPAIGRWDLIQRLKVKIVKNPGNGRINNLNDPVLNVLNSCKIQIQLFNKSENNVHVRYKFLSNTPILLYNYIQGNMFQLY